MKNSAAPPRRTMVVRTALPLIATLALVGACDSAVGLPSEQSGASSTTTETAASTTTPTTASATTATPPPIPP
ncbi:hypothetical protein CH255_00520, partial [Rhodococcus sp. 05-2255-2A2]